VLVTKRECLGVGGVGGGSGGRNSGTSSAR
jgi:hypothetical protein